MSPDRFANVSELPRLEAVDGLVNPLADERAARSWVLALPRANAQLTQVRLQDMLNALLRVPLAPASRLKILEVLRGPVLETVAHLEREFVGGSLPLSGSRAKAAELAETFHLLLGHGYRRAAAELCSKQGRVPWFGGGSVARALQRSLAHYARALEEAWRVYRQPAHSIWQGLHRAYGFAEHVGLDRRPVDDAQQGNRIDPRTIYVRTLVAALANPYSFAQSEQVEVIQVATAYAPLCELVSSQPDEACALVPDDADLPPGSDAEGVPGRWLSIAPLVTAIEVVLAASDAATVDIAPHKGLSARIGRGALVRLERSLGQAAARDHRRMTAGHQVEAVIGMSSLHYFLAGGLDFETFVRRCEASAPQFSDRAVWTHGAGELARVPVLPARVLDQSLGGYRLSWPSSLPVRARVGELIGVSFPGESDAARSWMVGVIRWLRTNDDVQVVAGVELLARRARAVGLRATVTDGHLRPLVRAIELDRLDGGGGRCFVAANDTEMTQVRVEVIRDPTRESDPDAIDRADSFTGLKAWSNAGEYQLLCAAGPASEDARPAEV